MHYTEEFIFLKRIKNNMFIIKKYNKTVFSQLVYSGNLVFKINHPAAFKNKNI